MKPSGLVPVSLEQLLDAREQRVARQKVALDQYGKTILSLTLVFPGPIKDSPSLRFVFAEALVAIDTLLVSRGWQVVGREYLSRPVGQEALLVVDCPAQSLKWGLVQLEDEHPLGRLWDMDVICPEQCRAVSRAQLLLAPRKCLVCGEAAHACARSRAHPLDELLMVIEEKIDAYRCCLA